MDRQRATAAHRDHEGSERAPPVAPAPRRMLAALLAGASARATARTVHVNKDTAALWKKKLASGDVPADLLAEARALLVALASEAER